MGLNFCSFEKFVAGCYLGEIVRHMIVFLTEKNQLFGGNLPMSLKNPYTFPTKYICEIERDPPHLFYTTEYILREDLKIPNLKMDDLRIVRYVCSAVAHRSACLAAAGKFCIEFFSIYTNAVYNPFQLRRRSWISDAFFPR
ncbi:unnamed protein product [Dibothriocephalus latus]|uniref:Phosphotransferase n=1 Tax=Dibothriocephalus latus TaxID=60516 RepID=A0A3P6Q6V9_DIBLA|nr:unnamed protein product [Dibothriocephalus latus]